MGLEFPQEFQADPTNWDHLRAVCQVRPQWYTEGQSAPETEAETEAFE